MLRVEESLDDVLKLTTNSTRIATQKPVSKKILSDFKPGGYKNKQTSKSQEKSLADEMDTTDIARYIAQEQDADSDVDLFS